MIDEPIEEIQTIESVCAEISAQLFTDENIYCVFFCLADNQKIEDNELLAYTGSMILYRDECLDMGLAKIVKTVLYCVRQLKAQEDEKKSLNILCCDRELAEQLGIIKGTNLSISANLYN